MHWLNHTSLQSFGCDGHLDSGYQYDKCGVCNGTGVTCREVAGVYSKNNISQGKNFQRYLSIYLSI